MIAGLFLALLITVGGAVGRAQELPANRTASNGVAGSLPPVTRISQFRALAAADYLAGCDFQLTGVVTLVDTNRDLMVLQDDSGAVALNFPIRDANLAVGQAVTLDGTDACPLFSSFPDYPYRPAGRDLRASFEAPRNWGEYNLTRMRGYLHPRLTGDYRFWIASDNSSELWLSTDATPGKARKIASVPRLFWVDAHQWNKLPSQHSETIHLQAGESYYIEALQEQSLADEHLSVAWEQPPPGEPAISVIDGRFLTPWTDNPGSVKSPTNGILLEYWTNYTAGSVEGMGGARPFESALTARTVRVQFRGPGELPKPLPIKPGDSLAPDNDYRWVTLKGIVQFAAQDGAVTLLEVSDGQAQVQVRALNAHPEKLTLPGELTNSVVQVEGVCEGVNEWNDKLVPGVIWAAGENSVSFPAAETTDEFPAAGTRPISTSVATDPALEGYFETHGVVTFNDRVFDQNYVFMQERSSPLQISVEQDLLKDALQVGRRVILGGHLAPGKNLQLFTPFFVMNLSPQPMPLPVACVPGGPMPLNLDGRWSELEGVVHSVNADHTLTIGGNDGTAYLWLGHSSSNDLARLVDAKIRARGVVRLSLLDQPLLLVPSREFLEVEEPPPPSPFRTSRHSIDDILSEDREFLPLHRVHIAGEVTYRDAKSLFVQDSSAGMCVLTAEKPASDVGAAVEVVGFPTTDGSRRALMGALVRPTTAVAKVAPANLDLDAPPFSTQCGTLVHADATLLDRKPAGRNEMLELQDRQTVFTATLAADHGSLPEISRGSRVHLTGVREDKTLAPPSHGAELPKAPFLTPINILLRAPQDLMVLSGPSWWTWKKAATLIEALVLVLGGALLWIYLLGRRLEWQQASQLAFSQQVLSRLEEERHRIAVNLHDSLGQSLLVIKHRAMSAIETPPEGPRVHHLLEEISGVTSDAIAEVRRITHGLRPYQLDRLGLTQAIRASVNQASENGAILFASRVENIDGLFDKDAEIHVYRVVQEAITNVVRHSAATEATVVIKKQPAAVSISIRDNGRGFDSVRHFAELRDFGFGLSGIAERVRILKGTLAVDSRPGAGTSLTAEVPFKT